MLHLRSSLGLTVAWNELKDLPREIGNLKDLRTFELHDNLLESIPPEVGELQGEIHIFFL